MTIEFTVSAVIPASPEEIYDAWLDSDGHTNMTGSPAHATANVGDAFDAWDGYISGKNLELEPGKRIVQSWRGSSYSDSDADSRIPNAPSASTASERSCLSFPRSMESSTGTTSPLRNFWSV